MKKRAKRRAASAGEVSTTFVRGAIATGLLSAIQRETGAPPRAGRAVLRHALQGGAALAAGTVAAEALRRGRMAEALIAAAGGAAGMVAIEILLNSQVDDTEMNLGKEEQEQG